MAIGYTELDFVDGQAPALSAANLNHIDEGVKACADQLDAESVPGRALVEAADVAAQRTALGLGTAALAGDASELAKGVVQLGATGVPSATKVPKALGADLVALITAAGYTLNPATGTASLDGIADGTTYKRVLSAIATALNALTGVIGRTANKTSAFDWDAMVDDGVFLVATTGISNGPLGGSTYEGMGIVLSVAGSLKVQIAIPANNLAGYPFAYRYYYGGAFSASWYIIWNSGNDGNGGQPPAPKPNTTSGAIGQVVLANSTPGNAYSLPAGGIWFYSSYLFNGTTSIYNGFLSGLATGGTEILPASAGNIWRGFAWRIE